MFYTKVSNLESKSMEYDLFLVIAKPIICIVKRKQVHRFRG